MKRTVRNVFALSLILVTFQARSQDVLLETLGVIGAQGIYSAYTAIGSMADGYHGEVYDAEFSSQLLGESATLMQLTASQMDKLLESNVLSEPDAQFVIKLSAGYKLLHTQAVSYREYIATGDEVKLKMYESSRTQAWSLIAVLLGLDQTQK